MRRRLNGSIQGKRAMHRARQKAKYKRQAQQRRNSKYYYYKPNQNQKIKFESMSDAFQIIIGAIILFLTFAVIFI